LRVPVGQSPLRRRLALLNASVTSVVSPSRSVCAGLALSHGLGRRRELVPASSAILIVTDRAGLSRGRRRRVRWAGTHHTPPARPRGGLGRAGRRWHHARDCRRLQPWREAVTFMLPATVVAHALLRSAFVSAHLSRVGEFPRTQVPPADGIDWIFPRRLHPSECRHQQVRQTWIHRSATSRLACSAVREPVVCAPILLWKRRMAARVCGPKMPSTGPE
jgi:hypothetical protein